MSDEHRITAEVNVSVDAETAFAVFTEEMDRWWVPGPINFYDSSRAVGMRCESGVGGRLIEVYDETSGEGLELGRIKVWEPGDRLAWESSIDDVEVTVRFLPIEAGTRVVVEAVVPKEGRDQGGSSWVRVAPYWFGAWCARRDMARRGKPPLSRLALTIGYQKPATAARWIRGVLGLESTLPLPDDDEADEYWIEFRVGDGLLVVLKNPTGEANTETPAHVPFILVDDLDSHHTMSSARGAKIIEDIHHYGYRAYTIEDLEGHHWTIMQALPSTIDPSDDEPAVAKPSS